MSVSTEYPEPWKTAHTNAQQFILRAIRLLRIRGMTYSDKQILALVKELMGSETKPKDVVDRAYLAWSERKDGRD